MQSPVQVTFRDIQPSDAVSAHVEKRAAKLDTFFDRITHCHVVVEAPNRTHKHGPRYHVRIDLRVPGKELVVSKIPEERMEELQPDTKTHLKPAHGYVAKIFADRGYGFIQTEDGREVYFHRNSVLAVSFDKLHVGAKVRFAEEDGEKGPQASTVHVHGDA
jgi:cold shock CspA family protein/ribosome-associated translation inhibitor RaiA